MLWLRLRNMRSTRPCKKVNQKKIRLLKILARTGTSAYKLDLSTLMKIYNTFHISILVLYNDDQLPSQPLEPPPSIIIEAELKYELEKIIDLRLQYNKLQYRARWTGYTAEHDKRWYLANDFENQDFAKRKIHCRYTDKLHLDQACGTGYPRHTCLGAASLEQAGSTLLASEGTNTSRKLRNNEMFAGNDADKHIIPLTLHRGGSRAQTQEIHGTPLDGVLQ